MAHLPSPKPTNKEILHQGISAYTVLFSTECLLHHCVSDCNHCCVSGAAKSLSATLTCERLLSGCSDVLVILTLSHLTGESFLCSRAPGTFLHRDTLTAKKKKEKKNVMNDNTPSVSITEVVKKLHATRPRSAWVDRVHGFINHKNLGGLIDDSLLINFFKVCRGRF